MALDFPKHMKQKNTREVSKPLSFSYLSAFHSVFSGFNPWVVGEKLCTEHCQEQRMEANPTLPLPMKIGDKFYFQESYVVFFLERIHYSYIASLVACAVGH